MFHPIACLDASHSIQMRELYRQWETEARLIVVRAASAPLTTTCYTHVRVAVDLLQQNNHVPGLFGEVKLSLILLLFIDISLVHFCYCAPSFSIHTASTASNRANSRYHRFYRPQFAAHFISIVHHAQSTISFNWTSCVASESGP